MSTLISYTNVRYVKAKIFTDEFTHLQVRFPHTLEWRVRFVKKEKLTFSIFQQNAVNILP